MKNKKMEKREYNQEKEKTEKELSKLIEKTLRLEDELNWLS